MQKIEYKSNFSNDFLNFQPFLFVENEYPTARYILTEKVDI